MSLIYSLSLVPVPPSFTGLGPSSAFPVFTGSTTSRTAFAADSSGGTGSQTGLSANAAKRSETVYYHVFCYAALPLFYLLP